MRHWINSLFLNFFVYVMDKGVLATIRLFSRILTPIIKSRLLMSSVKRGPGIYSSFLAVLVNGLGPDWKVRRIQEETTYVFIFLGEFGYELLNWQGVVRKFSYNVPASSSIVVAGRRGLYPFYEGASQYIDISDFEMYRNSIAAAYFAVPPDIVEGRSHFSADELAFDSKLRQALKTYVCDKIADPRKNVEFVFSSDLTAFSCCIFGVDREYYGTVWHHGKIYGPFDFLIKNNAYKKIIPDCNLKSDIEARLGFGLDKPYILIQTRSRPIGPQHGGVVVEEDLVKKLASRMPVILLSFNTGRCLDSASAFESGIENCFLYNASSFAEQGCLIAHSRSCVFFTEGDLGSHTYLPPLMGRDVFIVSSEVVFNLQSSPISGWNKYIFNFGGQMTPLVSEKIFRSSESLANAVDTILS